MFRIFRKPRWHRLSDQPTAKESPLHLDMEDRDSATATESSDDLVKKLFEQARVKAQHLESGSEVSVTLAERRTDIHRMEVMASLLQPGLVEEYGMQFTLQHDNTFYFRKV